MRGIRWKFLVIGLGLTLAAACGSTSGNSAGPPAGAPTGEPPTSQTPPPSSPSPGEPPTSQTPAPGGPPLSLPPPPSLPPPGDRAPVLPSQVDFSALPDGFPHEVWVSPDEKTLYIQAEEGGCDKASAEVRDQTAQRVAVALVQMHSQTKGQMCTMIIRYPVVQVQLTEPLAARQVVLTSEKRPN